MDYKWLLIICMGLWILFRECSIGKQVARVKELETENQTLQIENDSLAAQERKDSIQDIADSLQHARAFADKEKEAREKESTIRRLNANMRVLQARQEIPEIDTLLRAHEALQATRVTQVKLQGQHIADLYLDKERIRKNFTKRLNNTQQRYFNQKEITAIEKKKGKWAWFGAGFAAGFLARSAIK